MEKEYYTITEMEQLGYSREHMRNFVHSIHARNICFRVGTKGHWRINREKYEAWLLKNTV